MEKQEVLYMEKDGKWIHGRYDVTKFLIKIYLNNDNKYGVLDQKDSILIPFIFSSIEELQKEFKKRCWKSPIFSDDQTWDQFIKSGD